MNPPRRFRTSSSAQSPSFPITSTVFSNQSPPRRFKPARSVMKIPPFGFAPSIKKVRIGFLRPVLVLICTVTTFLYFAFSISAGGDDLQRDGLARYSHAASHFRKDLSPDALQQYYMEKAADIDAESPLQAPDLRDFVISDTKDSVLEKCMISGDHASLHPSLCRGPDLKEIDDRKFAKQPRDFDDTFAMVDRKRYLFHPDRPAVRTVDDLAAGLDVQLDDAIAVATAVTEKDDGGTMHDINVPVVYMRTTRQDGSIFIVNIGGKVNKTENGLTAVTNVRRIVAVSKGFGKPCEVTFVRPKEVVRIHVLLAYSARPNRLAAFLKMFAGYFNSAKTDMVRIVVSTTERERGQVLSAKSKHPELTDARFGVVTSKGDEYGNFSRAVAMREAAKTVPSDEVIFFSDADLIIGGNFLQNCRVNIVKGYQVWFPVMFSLYPYGKSLSSRDGLWRRSSYGMACMYSNDFSAVGGFGGKEETEFTGWGSEDVFLYNRFRDNNKYAVLRTLEPGLQHQWHGKECEHNEHYENCMRTVYMTIGSQDVIAKLMSEKHVDVSSLTKGALPI